MPSPLAVYAESQEDRISQWTPNSTKPTSLPEGPDEVLAHLSATVDEDDEEVSRIVPASTPSTAASTPTPPNSHPAAKQRAKSSMALAPTVEDADLRPGEAAARPGPATVRWRTADPPRPASSGCQSARGPRKGGKHALPPMSSPSPKGKREPPASPASPQSDACSHASPGELSLQATSSKKKGNQASHSTSRAPQSSISETSFRSQASQLPQDPALHSVAQRLNKSLIAYMQKKGAQGASWSQFFAESDWDGSGMISFEELDIAVKKRLKAPVSRYELRVFWRRLDEDSGQASIEEFGRLMYKIELSQWPDLSEDEIERTVSVLNQAAHKWHRAGGNWFKVFNQIDAEGSGSLSFDGLVSCVRGKYPCLKVSNKHVTDRELHGLWKALDFNGGIEVPVHRFMVFMRRWSGDTGLQKGGHRHSEHSQKSLLPPVSERSDAEVRAVANALERALSSYYIDRGYLSVASASEAAWHGGANDSTCSWTRFFSEMDKDGVGRLSYSNFLRAIFSKLKPWFDPRVSLPVGGTGRTVSKDDIRALWDKLDPSSTGEITAKGMMLGLYQVQLEAWPDLEQSELERLATLINMSAVRRLRSGGNNWYKIFNLVDKAHSGRLSFSSLKEVLRDMWYGLALSNDQVSDFELKGMWKALDENKSSTVTVGAFMVFMRRYGTPPAHNTSKQKLQSNHMSTMSEEEEWKQMLAEAPALDANHLMSIATALTLGIHSWLNKSGAEKSTTHLWPKFIEAANGSNRQNRLKYGDFRKTIAKIMRTPPSSNELLAFWREVDQNCTGEAVAEHFDNAVYRLQVDTWPELDEQGISKVIQILNIAAEKWHRASGNWYKVFLACDEDGSGNMTYDEMLAVFRKGFPGLSIPPQKLPEQDLRGFWRALDAHRSGRVEVYDFMIFMRKYGAQYSMHRSSRARKSEVVEDFGHPAERTDDELRQTAQVLDESLTAYWNRRGVHVRAGDKWQRFLDEADLNRDGLVTFQDLEQALIMRLKSGRKFIDDNAMFAFSGKVLAQFSADGAVVNGVSHDDLYALWCRIDADQSGRVSYLEWTNGMYRLRLDVWPVLTEVQQGEVVDKISTAASKRIGSTTNWYKVFKLVDVDRSGSIGYDEFFRIIRRPLPCLAISTKEITNDELKGLWKAMDADLSGSISCQEFMVFMRRLEVRRGITQWRPQVLSGKSPRASSLARAKAPPSHLSSAQLANLKEQFRSMGEEELKKAYAAQSWPWQGSITEWEWPHIIREVLKIPEDQLTDDGVFTAFTSFDSENFGEVQVDALLSQEVP